MSLHAAVHGSFCQLATFIWRIIFCAERLSWPIILYGRSILLFASACGKGLWVEHWLDRLLTLEPCPFCDCVVQHYRVPGQPRCRRENRKTLTLASVFFFFFFFPWFPPLSTHLVGCVHIIRFPRYFIQRRSLRTSKPHEKGWHVGAAGRISQRTENVHVQYICTCPYICINCQWHGKEIPSNCRHTLCGVVYSRFSRIPWTAGTCPSLGNYMYSSL